MEHIIELLLCYSLYFLCYSYGCLAYLVSHCVCNDTVILDEGSNLQLVCENRLSDDSRRIDVN